MRAPSTTTIEIPDFALIVLIGATGSGKSTFAARHFLPTEIVSSDWARSAVADDETDQSATADAFELVSEIASKRLKNRRMAVIDATNVRPSDRKGWVELARRWHALPVAIVIDPGTDVCVERNRTRPNRRFGAEVARRMTSEIRKGVRGLQREGFRQVWQLGSVADIDAATVTRQPLWTDKRSETGGFDIIGDVHGCAAELETLLARLGYGVMWPDGPAALPVVTAPAGRRVVFVGDLVDRGPRTPDVLRIAMAMVDGGTALAVNGNHDRKLVRWLDGRDVKIGHGLAETIAQLSGETDAFRKSVRTFLDGLLSHAWLDRGRLVVAHAGLKEEMIGRASPAVREFALYGETTGEVDEFGLPVRADWAQSYRGDAAIVYGHTPVLDAGWVNNTICIDTGCVFGGKLTALRWPERELVSVVAEAVYADPVRPLASAGVERSGQAIADDLLDMEDVSGRRWIDTELRGRMVVAEENAAAALEAMSRFAIAPQWLVYLPPTMSPAETSTERGWLERPEEALAYYRSRGVSEVVCEEKHMGSRAVVALCRDSATARGRFGTLSEETGAIWTRTGRAFFSETARTEGLLARLRNAVTAAGIWEELATDWLVLDAEIMPWSAKAGALIDSQYAPVAASSRAGLAAALNAFNDGMARGLDLAGLGEKFAGRIGRAVAYADAWRPYVWPVEGLDDLRVAPFHILASEGRVWFDQDHTWHMGIADRLAETGDAVVRRTQWRRVALGDVAAVAAAIDWWEQRTASGAEGMVVKPLAFVARGEKGLLQPAIKVRGRQYLRIIYGPEYDAPEHLERLRERGLNGKRNLALREFALGHEALRRFVAKKPLREVHECVFAVLAMESEPIDPRL